MSRVRASLRGTAPPRPRGRGTKAAVRLAHQIVGEIRRRGLGPGDKLISEDKMVARYGFARGTLREALRLLELQGVLRIKTGPGGGPVVTQPDSGHLASALALWLQFASAPLRSLLDARCAIEPGMAALAAERAGEDDLRALRECIASQGDRIDDEAAFHAELRRFHALVASASGNPVFTCLMPALWGIAEGDARLTDPEERRRAWRSHATLLRAIEARDAGAAASRMERLASATLRWLEKSRPELLERPITWSDGGT